MTRDPRGGIFLSYRREEAGHAAGRLADRISARFGSAHVFIDVESIPLGENFVQSIERAIGRCDALLALIGRQWLTMTDDQGRRRLDDPEDFVVLELKEALQRNVHVIPVLIDGAPMPKPHQLPAELRELSHRNAVRVDAESFRRDAEDLLDRLAVLLPGAVSGPVAGPDATHPRPIPAVGELDAPVGKSASLPPDPARALDVTAMRSPLSRRAIVRGVVGVAALSTVGLALRASRGTLGSPLRPRWIAKTEGSVFSSPTVSKDTLYVGSRDHHLYAFDLRTGRERWRYRTGAPVTSTPAVADDRVYVGSNDTRVHAVDAVSGRVAWTFPTGGALHSSPAVVDEFVFIGSRDNHVYALDAASGRLRWRFAGGKHEGLVTGFNSSPVVAEGTVYIGCRDHNIYAIDADEGFQRWRRTTGSTVDSSGALTSGMLVIGSDDQNLWALSTRDGGIIWTFPTQGGVVSRPWVEKDVVFIGSGDGAVYAVDASTGRQRWRFPTQGAIRSSPCVGLGTVYVGSGDFRLYALDATSGVERWSFKTFGPVDDSSPVLVDETVFCGSLDHRIYALDARRGAQENPPL